MLIPTTDDPEVVAYLERLAEALEAAGRRVRRLPVCDAPSLQAALAAITHSERMTPLLPDNLVEPLVLASRNTQAASALAAGS